MKLRHFIYTGLALLLVTGCGLSSSQKDEALPMTAEQMAKLGPDLPDDALGNKLGQCYGLFESVEKKRREADIHHKGYFQVKGYPYVRVDRLMASFSGQMKTVEQAGPWLEQMREYAGFARAVELRDIGLEPRERANLLYELSLCSVWLTLYAYDQEKVRVKLEQAIRESVPQPPQPINSAAPESQPVDAERLQAWRPVAPEGTASDETAVAHFAACDRDMLGRVGLFDSEWQRFATRNAPMILSEQALVSPRFDAKGRIVNTGPATIHYQPSFIRVGDQTLLQFVYYIWTANNEDAEGGFRGIIWRVTLAPDGEPLVYDSMGLDGSDHRWFAARDLKVSEGKVVDNSLVNAAAVTLTLSPNARLLQVSPTAESNDRVTHDLGIALYDDLSEMPTADEQQRSMFDSRGRLRVRGPSVYMLGQHPAINAARQAFDDPQLLDSVFKMDPAWLVATSPAACRNRLAQQAQ